MPVSRLATATLRVAFFQLQLTQLVVGVGPARILPDDLMQKSLSFFFLLALDQREAR